MALQNYIIASEGPSGPEMIHFSLRKKYPLPLRKGEAGASLNTLVDGSILFLNMALPNPLASDIRNFYQGIRFGIYEGPEMPGGLLLTQVSHCAEDVGLVLECPFDAAKLTRACPGSLKKFWTANKIGILATLTDTVNYERKVVAMRMMEMPPAVVEKLRNLWIGQGVLNTYETQYCNLARTKSIFQLWAEAQKF